MTAVRTSRWWRPGRPERLTPEDRAATWMIASLLLDYPDTALRDRGPELAAVAGQLPPPVAAPLGRALAWLEATRAGDAAAQYVATFDHSRRCCLHLTYYAHGDTRRRGTALLGLRRAYAAAGVRPPGDDELPDHLAVVLEFAATVDPDAGRRLLLDHRAGIELLRQALAELGSPYVDVVAAVCATLPPLRDEDAATVARLAATGPPGEQVGLPYPTDPHGRQASR